MGLGELIAKGAARLAAAGVPSPRHDAETLAAHLLGVGRGELLLQPEPHDTVAERYTALIERRASREPLQHITGEAHFRHLTLRVGPGVFIPRPETEVVAGAAIDAARAARRPGRAPLVVDLYAGSGAIALSVAAEVPKAVVHAVESDERAIGWLHRNAPGTTATSAEVAVHHADVDGCLPDLSGTVDVVVANPPYIPRDARVRDPEVAAHDPAQALWSGDDGLEAMRVLERTAARLLRPAGVVVAEHADVQGTAAQAVFESSGAWTDVTDHPDLTGRPRYVTGVRTTAD